MVAFPRLSPVSPLVPPVGGAVVGVGIAALFALLPGPMLEAWVWSSGIPALVAAAAPPLGTTARVVLALSGGAMAGSVMWSVLYLLMGPGGLFAPKSLANAVPVVRRADSHPDAPPRRPMTAADLGTPLMEVNAPTPPVEQPVPADLDQPLAAFDPASIPAVPLTPSAPVAPLARSPIIAAAPSSSTREPLAPGERIDTYVLTPPVATLPPQPQPRRPVEAEKPSIDALLRRLEEVAAQRVSVAR